MLKMFFRHYGCRNFSNSRLLKSAEQGKDVVKSSETPKNVRPPGLSMDFVPNDLEKTVLVLSGRFKSKAEIPERITYDTMENARSRFRIRGANVLMVLTLCLCGYYVWRGKKRAREGESLTTIYMDYNKRIMEDKEREKAQQS